MLDIKLIRSNPDMVKAAMKTRNMDADALIDQVLEIDVKMCIRDSPDVNQRIALFKIQIVQQKDAVQKMLHRNSLHGD